MNIFVLSTCPNEAATYMCDQHIVKMAIETAQMLSTAAVSIDPDIASYVYKPCYKHHPCTVWAGTTSDNYAWLVEHGMAICREFTHRYSGTHGSQRIIERCRDWAENASRYSCMTNFAQAMPDKYKHDDPVIAYRAYYIGEKMAWARWSKSRPQPSWIAE